mmetsp:Transcript_57588/g.135525  ORF Transcript_57588/g.135525 Transcript_57588/m.135525 type:complete len:96 (+) Transcript_57588:495-782(+)
MLCLNSNNSDVNHTPPRVFLPTVTVTHYHHQLMPPTCRTPFNEDATGGDRCSDEDLRHQLERGDHKETVQPDVCGRTAGTTPPSSTCMACTGSEG